MQIFKTYELKVLQPQYIPINMIERYILNIYFKLCFIIRLNVKGTGKDIQYIFLKGNWLDFIYDKVDFLKSNYF